MELSLYVAFSLCLPTCEKNSLLNTHLLQYWDWGRWAADPEKSPIFDGSDTSLSGNGKKTQHRGTSFAPAGNGGGCVETGPFKKYDSPTSSTSRDWR